MISVKTVILYGVFAVLFFILFKKAIPQWTNRAVIIFVTVIALYTAYILSLDLPGGLLNLFSLTFLSLEMFHILDVVGGESNRCGRLKWSRKFEPLTDSVSYTPRVSIHVPICKEPVEVVRVTLEALSQLDYPDYEVCVLVNNTTEAEFIEPLSEICKNLGQRFRFFHLPYVRGYKAGTLNYALKVTDRDAEIIAVVDSDYVVDKNFLKETVGYFKDPDVAIVQIPQDYRDFPKTHWFEGMYYAYRYFFSIVMNSCNGHNAASFMGTMGLVRKRYLEEIGGWCEDVITEDSELGMRIHERGYKTIYIDHSYGKGLMPLSFSSYKKQRFRWAFGNMQTIKKNIRILLRGNLTGLQKICYMGANTIWFNNLLIPFLVVACGIIFNLSDKFARAVVGPYMAFLLSRCLGFIFVLPRVLGISVYKGIYAFLSFLSITFPMSIAWLLCLVRPRRGFWRTPKSIKKNSIFGHLKEARTELFMVIASLFFSIMALVKGKSLWGAIAIVNFLIYLPSLWALKGFVELHESFKRKTHGRGDGISDAHYNEDWYNITPLEATTA